MAKIGVFFSGLLVLLGIFLISLGYFTNLLLPELGEIAYQVNLNGTYSPENYKINLAGFFTVAIIFIAVGASGIFYFLKRN